MMLRASLDLKARNKRELISGMVDALMEVKKACDESEDEEVSIHFSLDEISFGKGESPFGYTLNISELEEL